jgi:hypothetical protein
MLWEAMPRPSDYERRKQAYLAIWNHLSGRATSKRKKPRGPGGIAEPAPVKPDKPSSLSGGAAAALEFDD